MKHAVINTRAKGKNPVEEERPEIMFSTRRSEKDPIEEVVFEQGLK